MSESRAANARAATKSLESRTRWRVAIVAAAVGCVSLGLYVRCLCPTVYWSDSGELIASCVEPGIAHPNGSPAYTLLGWLFSLAPVGSPAYRINLLSAFAAAATVALAFLAAYYVGRCVNPDAAWSGLPLAAALASAVAVAVAPALWQKATVANKYPLAAAVCAAMLLVAVGRQPRLLLLGLLLGLGFGVHPFTLCGAPLVVPAVLRVPRGGRARAVGGGCLGIVLGLLPFLYLPLRSLADPARDWGNPETWRGFWWLVSGQEFKGLIFGVSARELLPNLAYCADLLLSHLGPLALILAALGALLLPVGLLGRRNQLPAAVGPAVMMIVADLLLVVTYNMMSDRYTWEAYLLPCYVALPCLATAALCALGSAGARLSRAAAWVGAGVVLLGAAYQAQMHYPQADKSRLTSARDHAVELARQLPGGALLVHNSSEIGFLLMYLDEVENANTGLTEVYLPLLVYDWYGSQLKAKHPRLAIPPASFAAPRQFVTANSGLPIYAYPGGLDPYISRASLRPTGFLYQVRNDAEPSRRPPLTPEQIAAHIGANDYDGRTVGTYLSLLRTLGLYYLREGEHERAVHWLSTAIRTGGDCRARDDGDVRQLTSRCRLDLAMALARQRRWPEAERQLAQARFLDSAKLRAEREVRWGLARARQGDGIGAVRHLRRALRHDPSHPTARSIIQGLEGKP